jgi:hypothetical protein
MHSDIGLTNVGDALASGLARLDIGLPAGPRVGSSITVADNSDEVKTTYTIQPSMLDQKSVFIALNLQYEGASANFQELAAKAPDFPVRSEKRIAELAEAIKKLGVK